MLQVIKRAAIGDGRNHRTQLQRGHGDAFAERAHLPYATQLRRDLFFGINSHLLARDVVSRQLAQAELMRVEAYFFKTQLPAQRLKIRIVGARQRRGQIHPAAPSQSDFGVFGDQIFTQRRQSDRQFDGRARLRSA